MILQIKGNKIVGVVIETRKPFTDFQEMIKPREQILAQQK